MTDIDASIPQVSAPNLPVMVHAQYVKDMSFENPSAPFSLRAGLEQPKLDINITLDAKSLEDPQIKALYEVAIRISARAHRAEQTLYIAEILYGATVSLPHVAEENHHPLLLIEVPKLIFPFARRLLADVVQEGGYSPLLLGPVDFASMYVARFVREGDTTKPATKAS